MKFRVLVVALLTVMSLRAVAAEPSPLPRDERSRDERSKESEELANDLLSGKVKAAPAAANEKPRVYFSGDCKDETGRLLNRGEKGYDECLSRVRLSPRVPGESSVGTQVTTPGVGFEFKRGAQ
ncbi:hypothetical protein WDW86_10855 [Bdellovibrionota bacterium FG-2]